MRPITRRLTPRRLSLRARLTLVYGGLFLLAGMLLLGVTYLLVDARMQGSLRFFATGPASDVDRSIFTTPVRAPDGELTTFGELPGRLKRAALEQLLLQGALALALVSAVGLALGWLVAGRVLQPLHRITETARRIASAPAADRGLHERIALAGPRDDVKELADTFDTMLERLDHAFDGQRRFVANASHELRTPLTLNRSLIELALRRRTASPDVRQLGEVLLDINARHERLINGLLLLASSEHELPDRSEVDLAEMVEHVARKAAAVAETAGVDVRTEPGPAVVPGDPVLLEQLVANLVENGIRHNQPTGGWVCVQCRAAPGGPAELLVRNTGPVIPRYEVPALFEPFRRFGSDRLSGAGVGLGLSIVSAIARAHGGEVDAEPRAGGGLSVRVRLPVRAADPA